MRELEMQAEMFVKSHLEDGDASTKVTDRTPEYSDDEEGDEVDDYQDNWVTRNGNRTQEKMMYSEEIITNNSSSNTNNQIEVPNNFKKTAGVAKKERYGKPTKRQAIVNNTPGGKPQFYDNGMPTQQPYII